MKFVAVEPLGCLLYTSCEEQSGNVQRCTAADGANREGDRFWGQDYYSG